MRATLRRLLGIRVAWGSPWAGVLTERGVRVERDGRGTRYILNSLSRFRLWGVLYRRGFFGIIRRLPEAGEPNQ